MDKAEQPTARALKPCPFCGGEAEIVEIAGGIGALFYASCKDDDCCGYHIEPWVKYARRIEAATAWNARTTSLAAQDGLVEVFYIDCEFDGHNGQLLSIALVGETDSIHIKTTAPARDDWVLQNVLPLMDMHNAPKSASVSLNDVGSVIRAFLGDCKCPVIIADSPVDIGRFCRALSTSTDGQWASTDFPAMRFEVHNVDCYPTTLEGAVQHNAWWDAMALKAALSAIKEQHHE